MPKVALVARFTAKEGKVEELMAAFGSLFDQVEKESDAAVRTAPLQRSPRYVLDLRALCL